MAPWGAWPKKGPLQSPSTPERPTVLVMEEAVQRMTLPQLRDELERTRPDWESEDLDGVLATANVRRGAKGHSVTRWSRTSCSGGPTMADLALRLAHQGRWMTRTGLCQRQPKIDQVSPKRRLDGAGRLPPAQQGGTIPGGVAGPCGLRL